MPIVRSSMVEEASIARASRTSSLIDPLSSIGAAVGHGLILSFKGLREFKWFREFKWLREPVVVLLVEVLDQARPGWVPSEHFPGDGGRGGAVECHEVAQGPEVLPRLGRRHRRRGHVEVPSDRFGDLAEEDAFVADR